MKSILSRRQFLKNSAVTGSLLSAKSSLANVTSMQKGGVKNIIFFYVPHGAPSNQWAPFDMSGEVQMNEITEPYEPVKEHCVFFTDMDTNGRQGQDLLGIRARQDVYIGSSLVDVFANEFGVYMPLNALALTCSPLTGMVKFKYTALDNNPWRVQNRLLRLQHHPMNDILQENIEQVTLSIDQTAGIEQRELMRYQHELGLLKSDFDSQVINWSLPEQTSQTFYNDLTDMQLTNAVQALKYGLTNVVYFGTGETNSQVVIDPENKEFDYRSAIIAQIGLGYAEYRKAFDQKVANLIQTLKDTQDTNGQNLLDSTLVVVYSNEGDGESHDNSQSPYMLAGGKFLNGGQINNTQSNDRFIDTVIDLMGSSAPYISDLGPIANIKK